MFLKMIAAIMFSLAGAAIGFSKADRLREKLEICRETAMLVEKSAILIRYQGLSVYELSANLKNCSGLSSLSFIKALPETFYEGENFHAQWKSAVNSQTDIPDEERKLILRFGDILGTSDIEGQLASIESIKQELSALEKRRSDCFIQKGRLYRSVGTLFGVMAGILVI